MSISPTPISPLEQSHLDFSKKSCQVTATTVSAVLLVIFSSVVLMSACLCLMLPNINVLNSVILRGVLPASIGFLISLPLILWTVKGSREKAAIRKEWIEKIRGKIAQEKAEEMPPEELKRFIKKELIPKEADPVYKQRLISDIKDLYPKPKEGEISPKQKMFEVLEKLHTDYFPKGRVKGETDTSFKRS